MGFPGGSEVKASACNAGDLGSILGSGRSPGEGNGNPLQYSCVENPMDRGAWWATVHGVGKSRTRLRDLTLCIKWITNENSLIAQGTLFNALRWPKWEGNPEKRGYVCMKSWFALLHSRNEHKIVTQLSTTLQQKFKINKYSPKRETPTPMIDGHHHKFVKTKRDLPLDPSLF